MRAEHERDEGRVREKRRKSMSGRSEYNEWENMNEMR